MPIKKRSLTQKIFLCLYLPIVFIGYSLYKWPDFFVALGLIPQVSSLFVLGKSPSFWYSALYTLLVCVVALKVSIRSQSPYLKGRKFKIGRYQRSKFISIFFVQLIFFFILPYILPGLSQEGGFFNDAVHPLNKNAYVYVSRGLTSWGGCIYIFVIVPISVWFFGKRYCSWFCACGNLAETVGVTPWGAEWVKGGTPRGEKAKRMEHLQTVFLAFGLLYGGILLFDLLKIFSAESLLSTGKFYQDFVVDFIFGALIGVGAYPFFGTRIWCRYGCPLAKLMELFGRHIGSRSTIVTNEKCKGIGHCTTVCPMGINVASFAHANKKAILGEYGLKQTPCISCGSCVASCPVEALSFSYGDKK